MIRGVRIGHAEDRAARTGTTVAVFDRPMRCAVDVRGGGPATRETDAMGPGGTLGIAHAVVLSGGSVFGLAAADAVAVALSGAGTGFRVREGERAVPLLPAACLYDLPGAAWDDPPYAALGREALERAVPGRPPEGSVGAGYGARAGAWRGGLGAAAGKGVAALVACNAIGSPLMPGGSCLWAWPFERDGEFGGLRPDPGEAAGQALPADRKGALPGGATSLVLVMVEAALARSALLRVATMAQDGLARALRPSHAPYDGDTVFAVCPDQAPSEGADVMALGSAAADAVARAVGRGVWRAEAAEGFAPTVREGLSRASGSL